MIDWQAIKDVTKPLVAELCGISQAQVRWKDEPEGTEWVDFPVVYLLLKGTGDVGWSEERRDDPDKDTDQQTVNNVVQKRFTLSFAIEADEANIASGRSGNAILDAMRSRFYRQSSIEKLHGIYCVSEFTPMQYAPYVNTDGRTIPRYVVDALCLTVDNDEDTSEGAGDFITEVQIQGTVKNGATDIPVNLDVSKL